MKKTKFSQKEAKNYYQKLYKSFPLHHAQEKKFLAFFKKRLLEYEKLYPHATQQDYLQHFGLPEDIIFSFYQHYDNHYVITHMKSRKVIQCTCLILIPVILSLVFYLFYTTYRYYQDYMESYPAYEEEIIYDYGTIPMNE